MKKNNRIETPTVEDVTETVAEEILQSITSSVINKIAVQDAVANGLSKARVFGYDDDGTAKIVPYGITPDTDAIRLELVDELEKGIDKIFRIGNEYPNIDLQPMIFAEVVCSVNDAFKKYF